MQSRHDEAWSLLSPLIEFYEKMDSLDVSNEVGHMRSVISLTHFFEGKECWMDAEKTLETARHLIEKYSNTFLPDGFYSAVIYLLSSKINFSLRNQLEGWKFLNLAREIRLRRKEQHFIPGLGTYFLSHLDNWANRQSAMHALSIGASSAPTAKAIRCLNSRRSRAKRSLNEMQGSDDMVAWLALLGHSDLFAIHFFKVWDMLLYQATPSLDIPHYLQLLALLSFHVFIQERIDVAIYETHLGGEFDATNIITVPIVTVITSISMDHVRLLGPTIKDIAWHKEGIFKSGSLAFSSTQEPAVATVLQQRATEEQVMVKFVDFDSMLSTDVAALQPKA
ncbi:hypothetical protein BDFG_04640 [Blastomyces dermatitidis ATCC 26199]|nr:hypothetical protein BDFG_04640 [Blastomyces dermatitidis ATCC 26199]